MNKEKYLANNRLKSFFKTIIFCLLIISASSLYSAEVIFETKIEKVTKVCYVYKMDMPLLTVDDIIKKCSKVLETTREKPQPKDMYKLIEDRYAHMGDDIQISMNQNGTELYYANFPRLKLTQKTEGLLSDKEAVELSYKFLKSAELLPKNEEELKIDHVGGIMQMLSNSRTPEKKAVVVYFYRELNGLRVRNYGSSITITVAESEIPVGVQYHWREVTKKERVSPKSFLDPSDVYKSIREDIDRVFRTDKTIIIDKIELVLFDNGNHYIQPAYCYQGIRKGDNEKVKSMPVLGYVPALKKIYEAIHHPAYSPYQIQPNLKVRKDE